MRAMDCKDPSHDVVHFNGNDDEELFRKIQQHRDQAHPDVTDEQIRELISSDAYDE